MTSANSPKELGYRLPAEWEPQEAVWFAWPVSDSLWPGCLPEVRTRLAELIALASRYETVRVLCPAAAQARLRAALVEAGGEAEIFDYRTDDVWCRDFLPFWLVGGDGEAVLSDWRYNAWGGKFPGQAQDNAAGEWLASRLGLRRFGVNQVLEGGAVESDGAGRLLVTESVLLNPNRNADLDRAGVEAGLSSALGIDEVLWLGEGLEGDDTDGHVDNLARFFSSDGILLAGPTGTEDPNFDALLENARRIQEFTTKEGKPYVSFQLPLPEPVIFDGRRLTASYLNFLVLNGAVIVPAFGQAKRDAEARALLADCFPGREAVSFDSRLFLREGGGVHCLSRNQPGSVAGVAGDDCPSGAARGPGLPGG